MTQHRQALEAVVQEIIDVTPAPRFRTGPEHNGYAQHVEAALSQTKVMDFHADRSFVAGSHLLCQSTKVEE
jgi:hypothetical protein